MSSPQLDPDPKGEKPTKNDNRTENWTPQDAADGCRTRQIWAAIYQKTLKEFQSPEIQNSWKASILSAYECIHANKDVTWVPRRYVAHQALKISAFWLSKFVPSPMVHLADNMTEVHDASTWPKDFGPFSITDGEKADLDDGYREFLERKKTAAAPKPAPSSPATPKPASSKPDQENVSKEKEGANQEKQVSKRKSRAESEPTERPCARKKIKFDSKQETESQQNGDSNLKDVGDSQTKDTVDPKPKALAKVKNSASPTPSPEPKIKLETNPDMCNVSSVSGAPAPTTHLKQEPIEWGTLNRKTGPETFKIPPMIAEAIDRGRMEREKIFQKAGLARDEDSLVGESFAVRVPPNVQQKTLFRSTYLIRLANNKINPALQIAWLDHEGATYLLCYKKNRWDDLMGLLQDYTMMWVQLKEYCRNIVMMPAHRHTSLADWLNIGGNAYDLSTLGMWGIFLSTQKQDDDRFARSPETQRRISGAQKKIVPDDTSAILKGTFQMTNVREKQLDNLLWNGPHTNDRSLTFDQAILPIYDTYETYEEAADGRLVSRNQAANSWMTDKYKRRFDYLDRFTPDDNHSAFMASCQLLVNRAYRHAA
ncbi:hypothetical protein CKAH01_05188 [Colletotrichum kahawae]|uniref:Uncharacterized protein n=1 Tax=Colletotrichum kahawae TaxID=34407 RepID=A0AAD9YEE4_COLKA|nr:hypothetical protein CKAH01_05188 [Colletotrichum kahawae]